MDEGNENNKIRVIGVTVGESENMGVSSVWFKKLLRQCKSIKMKQI